LDPERVPLDVNGAIDEALLLLQSELRRQRASLRLELAPKLPRALGDRVQLRPALSGWACRLAATARTCPPRLALPGEASRRKRRSLQPPA
jgi:C4-dicarboxylate-specific signal transduction histidine kinase